MSLDLIAWAKAQDVKPTSAKLLLVMLAERAHPDHDNCCWPSKATLARDTGLSVSQVCRTLDVLKRAGFIAVERKVDPEGDWAPSVIRILAGDMPLFKKGGLSHERENPLASTRQRGLSHEREKGLSHERENGSRAGATLTVNRTVRENRKEPQAARASASAPETEDRLANVERELRQAAGWESAVSPNLAVVGPFLDAVGAMNADWERDVLPTVRSVAARMRRPASRWEYFIDAVREAVERRSGAVSKATAPRPSNGNGNGGKHEAWVTRMVIAREHGKWRLDWGPRPGEPGCRVPDWAIERGDVEKARGWAEVDSLLPRSSPVASAPG